MLWSAFRCTFAASWTQLPENRKPVGGVPVVPLEFAIETFAYDFVVTAPVTSVPLTIQLAPPHSSSGERPAWTPLILSREMFQYFAFTRVKAPTMVGGFFGSCAVTVIGAPA